MRRSEFLRVPCGLAHPPVAPDIVRVTKTALDLTIWDRSIASSARRLAANGTPISLLSETILSSPGLKVGLQNCAIARRCDRTTPPSSLRRILRPWIAPFPED